MIKRIVTLGLISATISLTGCGVIEQGNVGVRTTLGKVNPNIEQPGVYIALLSSVKTFTLKESAVNIDNLTPKAKDNLSLKDMDITVYYKVTPEKIPQLYTKYAGQNVSDDNGVHYPGYRLVENLSRTAVYEEVSNQDSLTIHQHRDAIAASIMKNVQDELNKSDAGTFWITRVVIRQVLTDPAIEASILRAVQVQKDIEAKRTELELAKAEAARTVAEAEGTAKRNRVLNESITPNLIEYKKALAMEACASSQKCTMVMGNAMPIINNK